MTGTVCLDFDGVLNTYDGWRGPRELFLPREGALDFIIALLARGYHVAIHSSRAVFELQVWFHVHAPQLRVGLSTPRQDEPPSVFITAFKPLAIAYIDDRAIRFDGDYGAMLDQLEGFRAWWEGEGEAP